MSTVQEIEQAIEKLDESQLAELKAWLWDREIEADDAAGRLDSIVDQALKEFREGRATEL